MVVAPDAADVAGPILDPGPATPAGVHELLRIAPDTDADLIDAAVAAANAFIRRLPFAAVDLDGDGKVDGWPPDVIYGGNLLAGRLYRRRNSPAGVESFSDLGGAVYVQRNDPDIAMMLGLGAYARPIVG